MQVKLRVYASLAEDTGMDVADNYGFQVEPGTTVFQLLQEAGINQRDVRIVMINNKQADLNTEVRDGDEIGVFPSMGGA
ncbi:MAG: MoaD/ThiS family protein [bacterium]|jgi:molybdopterin synthase sulfur carrier subunit